MKQYTTTIGVDIGDKVSAVCVIDVDGDKVEESTIPTTQKGFERYFARREPCVVALEVGTHSPWISQHLESFGHEVLVANARMLPLIYKSNDKNDQNDAERLARVARMDPTLLKPLKHRSAETQAVLAVILARDALVRARTLLINHCRGTIKSTGERLPSCASQSFHRLKDEVPVDRRAALWPIMDTLVAIGEQIKSLEKTIETECFEKFPEASALKQVPGVGPITALAFICSLENPFRFEKNRDVAGYLGLRPRQAQSSDSNPQLRITKAGNPYLRRLLVGSAQYILGPFGPDTDLRAWGLKLAERGGKNAKKRAIVAVARKLSVLLVALWKTQATYEPLREPSAKTSPGTDEPRPAALAESIDFDGHGRPSPAVEGPAPARTGGPAKIPQSQPDHRTTRGTGQTRKNPSQWPVSSNAKAGAVFPKTTPSRGDTPRQSRVSKPVAQHRRDGKRTPGKTSVLSGKAQRRRPSPEEEALAA